MPSVYLAGPMDWGVDWRTPIRQHLEDVLGLGVKVFEPEFLESYTSMFQVSASEAAKILTARDRRFASESDYVFVNFAGATSRSMGTCVELGWADNGHTLTIAVIPPGNPHSGHPIVESVCDFISPDVDSGLAILEALIWDN